MQKLELVIGLCLLSVGIVPVSIMILAGQWLPVLPHANCFGPAGFSDGDGCGSGNRVQVQFTFFWSFISLFLLGIGVWFFVAGLKSKAIVSKTKPH